MRTKRHTTNYDPEAFRGKGPRLFNHTPYPDALLRRWWVRACQRMGADPNGVVVKFTCARYNGSTGWVLATNDRYVGPKVKWCLGRRKTMAFPKSWLSPDSLRTRIEANGAWVSITLPPLGFAHSRHRATAGLEHAALSQAERVERTLLHEAHHVAEDQEGGHAKASRGNGGRRATWGDRPEEIRAVDATRLEWMNRENAMPEDDTLILDFAETLRARHLDGVTCRICGKDLAPRHGYRLVKSRRRGGRPMATPNPPLGERRVWCYTCMPTVVQNATREWEESHGVHLEAAADGPRKNPKKGRETT